MERHPPCQRRPFLKATISVLMKRSENESVDRLCCDDEGPQERSLAPVTEIFGADGFLPKAVVQEYSNVRLSGERFEKMNGREVCERGDRARTAASRAQCRLAGSEPLCRDVEPDNPNDRTSHARLRLNSGGKRRICIDNTVSIVHLPNS